MEKMDASHYSINGVIGEHSVFKLKIEFFGKKIFEEDLKVPVTREL